MMVWSQKYAVGIKKIDLQHQELFLRVNALLDAGQKGKGKDETRRTLDFLASYVIEHFSSEEREMEKCGYPNQGAHKAAHAAFIKDIEVLRELLVSRGPTNALAFSLQQRVVKWLELHILKVDREFGAYFAQTPQIDSRG